MSATPIPDEREWTLVREAQYVEGRVFSGPDVDEPVVVVPKSSLEAAEAEVERLREALRPLVAGEPPTDGELGNCLYCYGPPRRGEHDVEWMDATAERGHADSCVWVAARRAALSPREDGTNLQRAASDDAVVPSDDRPVRIAPGLNGPSGSPTRRRTDDELELAHALYTVWMHAGSPTEGIIADRIRGGLGRVSWLTDIYPQLAAIPGSPREDA